MKILHLLNIEQLGGAEKFVQTFLPIQRNNELDVECAILCHHQTSEVAKKVTQQLEADGIRVHYHEYSSLWAGSVLSWISDVVKESASDLVHCHLRHAGLWIARLKRSGNLKIPAITTMHGYNDTYQSKHGLSTSFQLYFSPLYWITRFYVRKLNGLIFISNYIKEFYKKAGLIGKKPSAVIHHGYPVTSTPGDAKKIFGKIDAPQIVIPGRITLQKGHTYAIDALKVLKSEYPAIKLHLVGKGPFENELKEMISKEGVDGSVVFHGYKENVIEEIRKYDLALIPSYGESFGLVFLDAFYAGIPVVAFDLPAGNEIVKNGENGLLAMPFDVNSLVERIRELCTEPDLYNRIAANGRTSLIESFSVSGMAKKYLDFYKRILANSTNG